MESPDSVLEWLLDSDPAIRWQVMCDFTDESKDHVAGERSRVTREGWGATLLDTQRPNGGWSDVTKPTRMIELPDGSALRGLDYLRAARTTPDENVSKTLELVERGRADDGRWPLQNPDRLELDMGEEKGQPGRWNTLRALQVLRWAA